MKLVLFALAFLSFGSSSFASNYKCPEDSVYATCMPTGIAYVCKEVTCVKGERPHYGQEVSPDRCDNVCETLGKKKDE